MSAFRTQRKIKAPTYDSTSYLSGDSPIYTPPLPITRVDADLLETQNLIVGPLIFPWVPHPF